MPHSLTVTPQGRVYLPKPLCELLGLKPGQPVDLASPTRYGSKGVWHLDLRPTARRRLAWSTTTSPRITRIAMEHALPATLTLYLVSNAPEHANYYSFSPRVRDAQPSPE